ncbi:hypothetical protein SLS56_005325 [Neofusicoccum ribis]|uniref:Uncharacterized protein n=1 Tax=Neofusicoccum ribis TaxID=45134 RepID=A0ABR3STS8_9PEZI
MDAPSKAFGSSAPPQRAVKPNPLIQRSTGDAGRERRRGMFLKKVANDRDERRWAGRAEQVMLLDEVKRQKRRQAELEHSAPSIAEPSDEDKIDEDIENRDPMLGSSQIAAAGVPNFFNNHVRSSPLQPVWTQSSEEEAEAIAQQEDEELDALLALMEEEERRANAGTDDTASQHYGSDDDEYDNIFSEYLSAEQASRLPHEDYMVDDHEDYDAMDMS